MRQYLVIKNRQSEAQNPIQLGKGEWVEYTAESDEQGDWPGWIYCKGIEKEGWVPKQIIEKRESKGLILEDYDATEFDLKEGDIIVAKKILNGWVYGEKKDKAGFVAWAPLNHLKEIDTMNAYNEGLRLIDETFGNGKDNVISLATIARDPSEEGRVRPIVRSVDAYYEACTFYVVTHARSNKMLQIAQNPEVSVAGCLEMFTASGLAENLGWVLDPKNADLRGKLRKAFEKWYDHANNEQDENCCILAIHLKHGTLNVNHWEKLYHMDFVNKVTLASPLKAQVMKSQFTNIILISMLLFYGLPLSASFMAPSAGMLVWILLLLFINPLYCLSVGFIYARKHGMQWIIPILVGALFLPSIFIFYNSSALFYVLLYLALNILGSIAGHRRHLKNTP